MCCAKAEVSDEPEEGRYGEAALLAENHWRGSAEWDVDSGVCRQRRLKESQFYWWQPSHFQILLRKSGLRKKQFAHLRYVQQAGGHLAPSFVRELREALLGTEIFVMYGQTVATARLSYVPPEDLERKLGSIGKAISGVALRVLDDSGEGVVPGKIGEILAEGANVTQGYWRAPEETAISFSEGKFYTGDLGTVDDEGFIQPRVPGRVAAEHGAARVPANNDRAPARRERCGICFVGIYAVASSYMRPRHSRDRRSRKQRLFHHPPPPRYSDGVLSLLTQLFHSPKLRRRLPGFNSP
jgi:hypothetical protein